jgi:hypothetical protein
LLKSIGSIKRNLQSKTESINGETTSSDHYDQGSRKKEAEMAKKNGFALDADGLTRSSVA